MVPLGPYSISIQMTISQNIWEAVCHLNNKQTRYEVQLSKSLGESWSHTMKSSRESFNQGAVTGQLGP